MPSQEEVADPAVMAHPTLGLPGFCPKSLSGMDFTGCDGDALSKVLSTLKAASSEITEAPELGGKSCWLPSIPLRKDG